MAGGKHRLVLAWSEIGRRLRSGAGAGMDYKGGLPVPDWVSFTGKDRALEADPNGPIIGDDWTRSSTPLQAAPSDGKSCRIGA